MINQRQFGSVLITEELKVILKTKKLLQSTIKGIRNILEDNKFNYFIKENHLLICMSIVNSGNNIASKENENEKS